VSANYQVKKMVTRIKALQSTFGLMLTIVQLTIGFIFLARLFCSTDGIDWLWGSIQDNCGQFGYNLSTFVINNGIKNQVSGLLLILGFMIVGYILIVIVSGAVEKREKEMNGDMV